MSWLLVFMGFRLGSMGNRQPTNLEPDCAGLAAVGQAIAECRESLGLSRHELSARLHMGEEQLEALEQGALHRLPEPVFVKAMVRRLANHLQLDADVLVQQLNPPRQSSTVSLSQQLNASTHPPLRQRERLSRILIIVLGVIGSGTALWVWSFRPPSATGESLAQGLPTTASGVAPSADILESTGEQSTPRVILSSKEPSWIALRRNGTVVFEGLLVEAREVQEPSRVEIYAGRPDLVTVSSSGTVPRPLGGIDELRWYSLNPER